MNSFIEEFAAHAASDYRTLTAIADKGGERRTTYNELYEMSRRVASKLLSKGLAPGTPVVIKLGRCREYIAAYLGTQIAGLAAVTITPEYPDARVAFIMEDCSAPILIREDFFSDIQDHAPVEIRHVSPDTPVHIIYTSGSTGRPKGVLHTGASLCRMLDDALPLFDPVGRYVYAAASTFSFAICFFDILCPLLQGAEIHIVDEHVRKDASALASYYIRHNVELGIIAPQLLKNFRCDSSTLRRIISGGEMMNGVYSDKYKIINVYGTSESGLVSSFEVDRPYHNTPIGKPLKGCSFELGPDGELLVRATVAREYINLPEKSAATFERQSDGSILYHTGDIVRLEPDGNYVYLNRSDWMVKVNGQRVETLEIENVLKEIPGITNAAVKAFVDEDGQNYLCAYFIADSVSETNVRKLLAGKVPEYMIPRFIVRRDCLPLTISGKLDRTALQPPCVEDFKAEFRAPQTDGEKALCLAFEQILHCGEVGADDDFFALGGDSIKVLKLAKAVQEATGLALASSDVFEARTPSSISQRLRRPLELHSVSASGEVPLSDSQKGVYFECIEEPESTMYNIPFAVRIPAGTDVECLADAVRRAVELHPALFATIRMREDGPVMCPAGTRECRISRVTADSAEETRREFVQPFDLENGPLFRFALASSPEGTELLLDVHHLVFDGTSLSILLGQISEIYDGGAPAPETYTLFDSAAFEAENEDDLDAAREFFRSRLEGIDTDRAVLPDATAGCTGAGLINVPAPKALRPDVVERFARQHSVTENSVFLAAFAYALAAFAGTKESTFITAGNGRGDSRLSDTVGMFVRTLPLHFEIRDGESVAEFLREVCDTQFRTLQHDRISFGELSHDYGVSSAVSFVFQSELLSEMKIGQARVLPEEIPVNGCQSDIIFMVVRSASGYEVRLHYRRSVYSEALMGSFCDAVFSVAAGLMSCSSLDEIRLADEKCRAFVDEVNATEVPFDSATTVQAVLEKAIASSPDAAAILYKDRSYSYSEFDRLTRNLAAHIAAAGVGADDFVAVLVPRNEYMAIGAWGAIRSGAAFQPLDPTYPQERLEYMVCDSKAPMLVADRSLVHLLGDYSGTILYTDEISSLPDAPDFHTCPKPSDALAMIYTSGTTGKPKGSVLENRNLAAFWRNHTSIMGIVPGSRVASYASFGFDAGVMDVVTTLMSGATLCIIPDEIRLDIAALEDFFCTNGITHAFMTTQLGRMFAQQTSCPTLQAFLVGGEKLVPFTPSDKFRFINGYGPCETMGYICSYVVRDNSPVQPIGRPSGNTKLYVTDTHGRLLPVGAAGELCISGCQVGRGYLGLPEKTAAAFVKNPFTGNIPGYERMYRSGDVVRLLTDGNIEFIGRRDGQVKVRGFRVELTEVEEVIRRFAGVTDATVAAFDDPAGGKFIAAYVVGPYKIDIEALNAFILSEKPSYMVPAVTMQIEAIPYTQNQKVNRRALPQPVRDGGASEIVKPSGEVQQKIFDIAKDILGHDNFGVTTNLFEAGMTSIGLLKYNLELGKAFGKAIRIADIKAHPTISEQECYINGGESVQEWGRQSDYPLMQNQLGVFVDSIRDKGSLRYNIPLLMRVSPDLDMVKLRAAVNAAIDAHPYMKARINADQRIVRHDEEAARVEVLEVASLPSSEELLQPFEIVGGPLYRARIYVTPEEKYLFFDVHHIVADGTSVGLLLKDISDAYGGETLQAENWTAFEASLEEERLRSSDRMEEDGKYYDALLGGCNTECLPGRCPDPDVPEGACAQYSFSLGDSSTKILEFCGRQGLSLNAFFNAAFAYVLSEFIHSNELTYCTIYNGRGDSRLAGSFAMLVKTLPIACAVDVEAGVTDFVKAMGRQLMESMAADALSFAEISDRYGVKPDVFFNYQGEDFIFDSLAGKPAEMLPIALPQAKAPLSLELFLKNGEFIVEASCRSDMFCAEFVSAFVSAFITASADFTRCERLKSVQLLAAEERECFDRMNDTAAPMENVPAQTFFERWAAREPSRIAVRTETAVMTYGELEEKANRVATSLVKLGVGCDEVVGLILDRSELVPVAEIGIMKASGAFLPMLPTYPDERLEFCIKDAKCRFVVATRDIIGGHAALFAGGGFKALALEDLMAEGENVRPLVPYSAHQLAYCIYTSGSTGTPKGVMIEQHNLSNFVQTAGVIEAESRGSAILCMASISFDMSVTEIFFSLTQGKSLYIASEEEIHNLDKLLAAFNRGGVDIIMMTPTFAWSLLSLPEFGQAMSRLKAVVLGAEAFQPTLFAKLKALNPDMLIQNGYGPTECTQVCSVKTLTDGRNITIGSPFRNTKFYVSDERGNLLPRYAVGELIICGEGVCRGYVGLPEKNKATFFEIDGVRAYHSGDLVRVNRDLEVEFGGRKDNQVKLRGFRVELDEVEAVMEEFEGVTRSKVVVRNNGNEDFLAGFFTADKPVDINALTAFMKTKLTYYMVPAAMMQLDRMPVTQGGKLDKKALPEIKPVVKARVKRAPKKSLEGQILDQFCAALGLEECYVDDNFFELGGTSLSASKVVMQLKSAGCKIEYQDIFDHQTAAELAEYLEGKGGASVASGNDGESAEPQGEDWLKAVLSCNSMDHAAEVTREPLGDVLLTGATGFLGCHILKELLDSETGHIYCVLRKGHYSDVTGRLKSILFYYFDERFDDAFRDRISIVEGDITDSGLKDSLAEVHFDTLINCAACVKHFASDDSIEFVNVHGVENLIGICREKGANMIQISTTSIPGAHNEETYKVQLRMKENSLFVVDDMNNQYCQSKYKAEMLMFAAVRDGMRGKVIRVGNLMGRHKDGEFQINMHTNAFLNGLRGFAAIGKCPISHSTDAMRFSPIDCTARAVVLLAGTNDCFTAFNADSRWSFDEMKVIEAVNRCGIKVTPVADEEYYADFYRMMGEDGKNEKISALLTNDRPDVHVVETDNRFTTNILYRLGFSWPFIDDNYLEKTIEALSTTEFF